MSRPEPEFALQPVSVVDILDRVLGQGAVVTGDLVLGLAGIDLVRVSLRALLASVGAVGVAGGDRDAD